MSSTKVSRSSKKNEVAEPVVAPVVAPVVDEKQEVVDGDDGENEAKKSSVEELLMEQAALIKQGMEKLQEAKAMNNQIRSAHKSALRQKTTKKPRKNTVQSGILKLVTLPPEAETFLKEVGAAIPENHEMRRTEFSGALYDYIKSHNLYKPDPSKESGYDRKVIIPDVKIRKLFSLSADKTLDFSSINVNLATIYRRAKELLEGAGKSAAAAPAPVAAAPAKKGKVAGASA
jgi:chromatin remodeling complex protein RSC6